MATLITPIIPCSKNEQGNGLTWVSFRWKYHPLVGQFWMVFNTHTYTILVFMSGWVFFRAENPSTAISFLKAMAGFGNTHFTGDNANFYLTSETIVTLLIAIALSTPVWRGIDRLLQLRLLRQNSYAGILQLIDGIWLLILFVLCAVYINEGSYNPFIYFRF